jgi:hypothetical protein
MKHLLFALLASPLVASAHPGHSIFDGRAGAPHQGHVAEYLVFGVSALGVLWTAVRAYRESRD